MTKRGYEDRFCPHCRFVRYFDGNECQVCHNTFSDTELQQGQELIPRLKSWEFLCDSCMFDWRSSCKNPDRPNAKVCLDYKRKSG